jgi:hypothetical protein
MIRDRGSKRIDALPLCHLSSRGPLELSDDGIISGRRKYSSSVIHVSTFLSPLYLVLVMYMQAAGLRTGTLVAC